LLNNHPEIGKPRNGLHFFSDRSELGINWYAEQMEQFSDRKLLLEFSVSYLYPHYSDMAAKRIVNVAPNAKIFLTVRNPVQRAYSDYLRSIRMGEFDSSLRFDQAIELNPVLLDRSRYARLLAPYLDSFSRDRILVLLYEDLQSNPISFAHEFANFLELSSSFNLDFLERAEPTGKTVRSQILNNTILGTKFFFDSMALNIGLGKGWSNWKERHVKAYQNFLDFTHKRREIDETTFAQLSREFVKDVEAIEMLTGKDLKGWYGPKR
jgi:hypothetical protein